MLNEETSEKICGAEDKRGFDFTPVPVLVIAIFYSVYSSVNFYSYKNESQRSSVTAISREASVLRIICSLR